MTNMELAARLSDGRAKVIDTKFDHSTTKWVVEDVPPPPNKTIGEEIEGVLANSLLMWMKNNNDGDFIRTSYVCEGIESVLRGRWGLPHTPLAAEIDRAVADKKEACARVAETFHEWTRDRPLPGPKFTVSGEIASEIRNRKD